MNKNNLSDETRVLGQRAAKCVHVYNETQDWQEVLKTDSLMVYSTDFRKFVASKCGLKENGEPLPGATPEMAEADKAIEAEAEAEAGAEEVEPVDEEEEAEEADEADAEEEEETAEEEEPPEEEEEEEEEEEAAAYDLCHWCNAAPATVVLTLQVSDGDEPRVLRLDHLCPDCAAEYWNAVRATHKERME